MQRISILFSLLAVFFVTAAQAQTPPAAAGAQQASATHPRSFPKVTIADSELRTIKSTSTGRDYDLYIHIPKQYDKDQATKYPVLYALDGQWDFELVDHVVGNLVWDKYLPEVIIVGIAYSGEDPDYDALRAMDYSPTPVKGLKGSGDGPKFLKFLKTELIPFVETNYRVDPGRRVLMGGSFGGLFTLYAMFSDPSLFSAYLADCPGVTYDDYYAFKQEAEYARTHKELPVKLFVAVGGWDGLRGPVQEFMHNLQAHNYRGLQMEARIIEGERHAGSRPQAYSLGLIFLFSEP
jgi:predicted alpha/beta superfamily hydrolase